ncbi:GNAT family N-acetyltransferase [Vibrio breoganii]|uniref:GNAT family N-acetyltransferase n=1 Tax=Vibrio breoganii TaxID=553239 RepID=UPI000C84984B|nr:GNAT family protein [Vibrio breoganii]PMM41667.1 GNAT family N-acetyltransferase [Vibrio breoganii]
MSILPFLKGESVALTSELNIQLIQKPDLQDIITMLDNPKVAEYLFFAPAPAEMYEGYFGPMIENTQQAIADQSYPDNIIGIIRDNSGRYIGMAAITSVMFMEGNYEIGYQLSEHAWKQGIATAACQFFTKIAFDVLGAHKVCADCYATNVGSYRTLEKNGYEREGVQKSYYKLDNDFDDRLHYGMTRQQYLQK